MADKPKASRRGDHFLQREENGQMAGQSAYQFTEEMDERIRKMAGLQVTQREIGEVLGISEDTIQRHHSDAFRNGRAVMGVNLRQHAYNRACGVLKDPDKPELGYVVEADGRMIMFLLERQHGMVPQTKTELTGKDGGPIRIKPEDMGDDELAAIAAGTATRS